MPRNSRCTGDPSGRQRTRNSWTPGPGYADTWGPYHQALFRPHQVTEWIRFKIMSSGVNVARRLWDEREALRADYETEHGVDPARWPVRHPGIVLESVQWVAHAACLGCQWFDRAGTSMRTDDWRATAAEVALRHQNTTS